MHAWAEVCHLSQRSKSVLAGFLSNVCSIGWRMIDQTRLSSNTPCTPTVFLIQQSCIIITFHCYVICVHAYTWGKKWHQKVSHSSSVSGSNRLVSDLQTWKKAMGWCTAQWKMLLFCAKTIVKESCKFELAHLKKMKKENISVVWWLSVSLL